ncbi:hypothetical protein [Blastococcus goldschmidtiae]|uniref:Uncharacterized protein n=1 Tax=Blastococcus goldschmidtiae TaxID=3075546 RepID=A0ABU2K2Z0_9ACTN|nr:hypothetical protein [Blastococcus sp. DSM 46792]MDT0274548.1 hypothetical protein [Blastococcus sp. DSM 46792]
MRARLLDAPAWRSTVVSVVTFFAVVVLWGVLVRDESWAEVLVRAVVVGLVAGAVVAFAHRQRRADDPDDRSPRAVGRRVRRAASRGPVPEDPDEREAAHDIALDHLRVFEGQRYWAPATFVVTAVLAAGVALTGPAWVWVTVPVWLAAAAGHPWLRNRMRARAELLAPGAPPAH